MAKKEQNTIEKVVEEHLCTSCGACGAICPSESIKFYETIAGNLIPTVKKNTCSNCGICLSVCPSLHFGKSLKKRMPKDPFLGNCLGSYIGKAMDEEIYMNSQSGGVATALSLQMLENGQADAIITVVMEWGDPPRAKIILAKTRDELLKSQKSKYCPIPNLEILNIVKEQGLENVILIGTPCQIHGLLNLQDIVPLLGKRIVLTIGLFCSNVMVCTAIDHMISEATIKKNIGNKHINYRDKSCNGYPGDVLIRSEDGKSSVLPNKKRSILRNYYTPIGCWLCFDHLNIFSDITVGDPWKLGGVDKKMGESVVVSRTKKGHKILKSAIEKGIIKLREVPYCNVANGQKIELKKKDWYSYISEWKKMGNNAPDFAELVLEGTVKNNDSKSSYRKQLNRSLLLFEYSSREELIQDVRRELIKKRAVEFFALPKKALKKIFGMIRG